MIRLEKIDKYFGENRVLNSVDLNSPDYYGYYGYSGYSYGAVDSASWETQGGPPGTTPGEQAKR